MLEGYEASKRPIVYLDESGFKAHDHRPYGYAPKGESCVGQYNWQLKNKTNAIGAIYEHQLFAVGLYDRSINSDVFHDWVAKKLMPELPKDCVIVMDNATFHKRKDTQELIQNAGHTILYLPPYSPNFNLIEQTWAWVKRKRKDWRMDCIESLFFYFTWICSSFKIQ
jgi:transposase